ncbi:mechanosensitive ion channel family protein [Oligoflexia bacterium]|nr:mechanosensitive ion channel family protein [Oligoflexia bacterium]
MNEFFITAGLGETTTGYLTTIALFVFIIFLAVVANFIAKKFILRILKKIITASKITWDDLLIKNKVFDRLSHIAPALVIYGCAAALFPNEEGFRLLTERIAFGYMILIGALVVDAVLSAGCEVLETFQATKDHPIKTYVQVLKIILYALTAIFILGTLLNRSPWALISGLGAMTAIVMLVFKDSILGFVASIQLAGYNLVRVGDWISFPKYGADGDVIDISLNVIRIQNWDKTIASIPTHAFMSNSYSNWRGMSESGGRRIKRAISVDMTTVKFSTAEEIEKYKNIHLITDYITSKNEELKQFNRDNKIDESTLVNGRRITNLGTFRAYIEAYIKNHPMIHKGMTLLVRQLAPTETGIPIEIYAFSSDQSWGNYEAIQADIFDHIVAVISQFDLKVFQNPTGSDFGRLRSG